MVIRRALHAYPGNMFGGVETALVALARTSGRWDHEFAVWWDGDLAATLCAAGRRVHVLGPSRWRRPWTVARAQARFAGAVLRGRPDVVVTHGGWAHAMVGPVARALGRRLVHFVHGVPGRPTWLERAAMAVVPDLVLANGLVVARALSSSRVRCPMAVQRCPIERPLDLDRAAEQEARRTLRAVEGARAQDFVILLAARLDECKGHAVLLDALARIPGVPWVAWIAGAAQAPAEAALLRALRARAARSLPGERVRFLGFRADVPALMAAADVYCQPNVGPESYGITFVEALARGLPVVTSPMGGALETVTPECGALVPPEPAAVASALARLADPVVRAEAARQARARGLALVDPVARVRELEQKLEALLDGWPVPGAEVSPRAGRLP